MPLFSLPDMRKIKRVPHDKNNRPIINRLKANELQAITDELNNRIDAIVGTNNELITAGWIPVMIGRAQSGNPFIQRQEMIFK